MLPPDEPILLPGDPPVWFDEGPPAFPSGDQPAAGFDPVIRTVEISPAGWNVPPVMCEDQHDVPHVVDSPRRD